MAGIFAVLALSLNLLLGYTGQLSLGHAAFFGIGAYTSALLSAEARVVVLARPARRRRAAGPRRLGHRPARAQAARRLLRAGHHQLRRRGLAGERELDGADQRPARPARRARRDRAARAAELSLRTKSAYYYLVLAAVALAYLAVPPARPLAHRAARWSRCARTRRWPSRSASTRRALSRAGRGGQRRDGRRRRAASTRTTRASSARRSSCSPTR